jgi:hypothetical protein
MLERGGMRREQGLASLWIGGWVGLLLGRLLVHLLLEPIPSWEPSSSFDPRAESAAIWLPVLLAVTGAGAAWFARRRAFAFPLISTVALLTVAAITFAVLRWTEDPAVRDSEESFSIWSRMLSFLRHDGGAMLMIAAAMSWVLYLATGPARDSDSPGPTDAGDLDRPTTGE